MFSSKIRKPLLLILICLPACFTAFALPGWTPVSKDTARAKLAAMRALYKQNGHIEMTMYSVLSHSDSAAVVLDSVQTVCHIKDSLCYIRTAEREYLRNTKWVVSVFPETREIYLDTSYHSIDWTSSNNPLQAVDSIATEHGLSFASYEQPGSDTLGLMLDYDSTFGVYKAIIRYDRTTGRLFSARYHLPITGEDMDLPANAGKYYIVDIYYAFMIHSEASDDIFNEKRFLTIAPGGITLAPQYSDYMVIPSW